MRKSMGSDKKYSLNYKRILEKSMSVTFDSVGIEDGQEVERMWIASLKDEKYVEDYMTIKRTTYDAVTDEGGAVFAMVEGGRMLVKAPNVPHYRIPEDVFRVAANAFRECTELKEVDVPYNISSFDLSSAMKNCKNPPEAKEWYWSYDNKRSKELEKEIAEGYTDEYGFVYSQDRKRLLKAANIERYWIPEGVEQIERLAFVGCSFEELHVPYTCKLNELSTMQYPVFGNENVQGCVVEWNKPYSQEDEMTDSLCTRTNKRFIDKEGVIYSANRKRLLGSRILFNKSEYQVLDGVETICSYAFVYCKQFLTLSVPSSIKIIGDDLFGKEGGRLVFRKE